MEEETEEEVVLRVNGNSFSLILDFIDGRLVSHSIEYNDGRDDFFIAGANVGMGMNRSYYIDEEDKEKVTEWIEFNTPVDKDLLAKFNETVVIKYNEKVMKRQISESDARQLLSEFLDYIGNVVTRGGVYGLTEKVKKALYSENIKVEYPKPEEIWVIIDAKNKS
mgnify:CR=1 FL=1